MKVAKFIPVSILLLLVIAGCSKREHADMRPGKGGKKLGGRYTLNEIRGNPSSLDPVRMNSKVEDDIGGNIFDKLIDNNSTLELVPELATHWEVSPDGLVYTFHLRSGVRFHDDACFAGGKGRAFNAKDVKYSFERVCDAKTLTSGFWIFQDIVVGANEYFAYSSKKTGTPVEGVSGFEVKDDSTFAVHLTKPFAPFLEHLTTSFGYILPHEAIEKYSKDFFQHPIGTGAFRFDHWAPDQEIVLKCNPNYWQLDSVGNQLPFLDEVRFTFIKDDKTLLANFKRGAVDEDFTLPTESFREIVTESKELTPAYAQKYSLQHVSAMNSYFMEFLCTSKTFRNMALRRALSFAVDRNEICKFVLKGAPHGPAEHGIVPPAFVRYPMEEVHGIAFNPDSARYWLAQAGYPDGKGLPPIVLSVYNEPRPMQIAEAAQNMWKKVLGIQVDLHVLQSAQLLDESEDGKLDLWLTRWYADYPEVENFLNLINGRLVPEDQALKSYPNSARWKSKQFDDYFYQGLATNDEAARLKFYALAESVAAYEAPTIPLFYEEHYRLVQNYVRDYPLDPMNRIDLKTVWLDK